MLVINLVIIWEKVIVYINLTINFVCFVYAYEHVCVHVSMCSCMCVCVCVCACVHACVYASAIMHMVRIWCPRESEIERSQKQRRSLDPHEETDRQTDRLFYLSQQLASIYVL